MNRTLFRAAAMTLAATGLLLWQTIISPQALAYQIDHEHHILTISPQADPEATTQEIRAAADYLLKRPDQNTHWYWEFQPGAYYLSSQIRIMGLKDVELLSHPNNPAQLFKALSWNNKVSGEYLMVFLMGKRIGMSGFELYGQTSFASGPNPNWGDQGILFGSCNTVLVEENRFFNFGNAALRVTTVEHDPVPGVHSFNTSVLHNTFTNIYQISTTSNDRIHGATANYVLDGNTFIYLRGSVKFASRTAGAEDVHIVNNVIEKGDHYGLEINNFDKVDIRGNRFQDIDSVAINIYTASGNIVPKGFSWGNHYTIADNIIERVGRGIRFAATPFQDGFRNTPQNLIIRNNVLSEVREPDPHIPAIWVTGGKVDGVQITDNKLMGIANKKFIDLAPGSTHASITENQTTHLLPIVPPAIP